MVSQLLWTLVGSGQGGSQVKSVQLNVNGKPFIPAGSAANPVQNQSQASYGPATGASATAAGQPVYYLDSAGDVYSDRVGVAGVAGKQTLSRQDRRRVHADRGLPRRQVPGRPGATANCTSARSTARSRAQPGSGYTTLSWDPTDNLWTTTGANDADLRVPHRREPRTAGRRGRSWSP